MKLPCEMIQDLLPLYHDGVCSEVSKTVVQEHLKTCEDCGRMLKSIDTKMEVPKLEVDAAKPLKALTNKWRKQSWRKGLCIGLAVFLVFITCWWCLTQWCIVPLTGTDYATTECYQLSNGYIYIGLCWDYGGCGLPSEVEYTDAGDSYYYRLRPILADRENGSQYHSFGPEECFYFLPGTRTVRSENGDPVPVTTIYVGTPDHAVLVWEDGMEIPPAPAHVEESYRQLEDSYNAPNAPERPATIHVIQGIPEDNNTQSSPSDSREETAVSATTD